MIKRIKQTLAVLAASLVAPTLAFAPVVRAESATLVVTEANKQGWVFNSPPLYTTAYEFTEDESSIGAGSLYVEPIDVAQPATNKFIAAKTVGAPTADVSSVSFDFMLDPTTPIAKADQIYLNVYTNLPGSNTFYDCRFDYVANIGSTTEFTTVTATSVTAATVAAGASCPASKAWADMPTGSTASFVSINLGDTGTNDVGVGAYFDNAVFNAGGSTTVFDFELNEPPVVLANKEQCKNGGWATSELPVFRNQGACVSYFAVSGNPKAFANNPKF